MMKGSRETIGSVLCLIVILGVLVRWIHESG
jgi:hypothetical protein